MKQTRALIEGAITVAIFAVILLLTTFVPFLSIISVWFLPLPIIYYIARQGMRKSLLVVVVAIVVSLILAGPFGGLFACYFLITGSVMGGLLYYKKSAFAVLLGASLSNIAMLLIMYGAAVAIFHFDPVGFMQNMLNQSIEMTKSISNSLGQDSKQQVNQLQDLIKLLPSYIPFIIVMWGVLHALIVALIITPILRRLRVAFPKWQPFREWRFPKSLIWYYLVVLIIMMVVDLKPDDWLFPVVVNLYQLLEVAMVIQGLSFIFFYAYTKGMGKALPIIAVVIAAIVPLVLYIIRILGIIDLGFDLRSRLKKK